jgi:pimeloyl-ACP methyl ester carboxylesterase
MVALIRRLTARPGLCAAVLIGVVCGSARAQLPAAPADRFVPVFGQKIHYVEAGSGPAVILIHGLGDDTSVWSETIAPLSRNSRVIALDQIGFGRSDKPLVDYRVRTFSDFLEGFLKELKIPRASLVGSSLGGWIAADFALGHPAIVERLVLVDAPGLRDWISGMNPRTFTALRLATREDIRYLGPLTFHDKRFYEGDAALDAAFAQRMSAGDGYTVSRTIDSIVRGEDVLDNRLSAIRCPTLIVWGREDGLVPLRSGERLHAEIAGSRLVVLEKCGHMPPVESAAAFNAAIESFLGGKP